MINKGRPFLAILSLAAIIPAGMMARAEALSFAPANAEPAVYENTADFSCGIRESLAEAKTSHDVSIVFHNPNEFPVMLNNYLSLRTGDLLIPPELSDRYLNVILSPKRYFEITCRDIDELFFPGDLERPAGQRAFHVQIQSRNRRYLNIALHYSRDTRNPVPSSLE